MRHGYFRSDATAAAAGSRAGERTTDHRVRLVLRSRRVSRLGLQRTMLQVSTGQVFFSPLRTEATAVSGRPEGRPSLIPKEISTSLPEMANSTSTMAALITATRFLKLRFAAGDPLAPLDYFTPFDQKEMDVENLDLGASGPMVLPDQLGQHPHLLFGAAKNEFDVLNQSRRHGPLSVVE